MGLLWWKNNKNTSEETKPPQQNNTTNPSSSISGGEVVGMKGAEVVKRPLPTEVSVFEFGSISGSADKVTLAGYCPVSEDLEPCRWELLTDQDSDAPQFRVVF